MKNLDTSIEDKGHLLYYKKIFSVELGIGETCLIFVQIGQVKSQLAFIQRIGVIYTMNWLNISIKAWTTKLYLFETTKVLDIVT